MTFNLAANLEMMDKDELYALQAALVEEIKTARGDRLVVLTEHLNRVDSEVIGR